jgi:hypothetical protein
VLQSFLLLCCLFLFLFCPFLILVAFLLLSVLLLLNELFSPLGGAASEGDDASQGLDG